MRLSLYYLLMAVVGYAGGNAVGYALTDEQLKQAMCSYYSEWDFCKSEKSRPSAVKDLAIMGLSRQLHEVSQRVVSIEKRLSTQSSHLCVKAYRLNIRLYPLDGKVIGIYKRGARVQVLDRIASWVRTDDGWISARYLGECSNGHKKVTADMRFSSGNPGSGNKPALSGNDSAGTGKIEVPSSSVLSLPSSKILR